MEVVVPRIVITVLMEERQSVCEYIISFISFENIFSVGLVFIRC